MGTDITLGAGWIQLGSDQVEFVRMYFDGTVKAVKPSLGETIDNTNRIYTILK